MTEVVKYINPKFSGRSQRVDGKSCGQSRKGQARVIRPIYKIQKLVYFKSHPKCCPNASSTMMASAARSAAARRVSASTRQ